MSPTTDGLRDKLEHRSTIIVVSTGDQSGPRLTATVTTLSEGADPRELLSTLRVLVAGICGFWTALTRLLVPRTQYEWTDLFYHVGLDDEAGGFWPPIE